MPETPDAPDLILASLAEQALSKARELASKEELRSPVLVVLDGRGEVQRFLITTPSVHPSDAMKIILLATQASHAAICFESWIVDIPAPDDPTEEARWKREALRGRLPAGVPRPSQHPDRKDGLILIAQARDRPASGAVHRCWAIDNGPPRTFEEQQSWADWQQMPARFWPMFVEYPIMRELVRQHAELARLRDQLRGRHS